MVRFCMNTNGHETSYPFQNSTGGSIKTPFKKIKVILILKAVLIFSIGTHRACKIGGNC